MNNSDIRNKPYQVICLSAAQTVLHSNRVTQKMRKTVHFLEGNQRVKYYKIPKK